MKIVYEQLYIIDVGGDKRLKDKRHKIVGIFKGAVPGKYRNPYDFFSEEIEDDFDKGE